MCANVVIINDDSNNPHIQQSMMDSVMHPSSVRQLQNCTSSDSGCMDDSISIEDSDSNITSVVVLILFAIMMIFQGLKLYCIDIPRERNNARAKARHRQGLIENLMRKRVKRVPAAGNDQDLENGLGRVVASPRNCRLQKRDLGLPISNAVGDVDEEEQKELICPICREDYKENDEICYSQNPRCAHSFHFDCIKPWLEKHDHCPICRSNYLLLPIAGGGTKRQALDTSNHRDETQPISFPSSLASALQQIRRELIESSTAIREVQSEMIELASELGDTNEAANREAGQNSGTLRSSNRTSFNTDLSEAAKEPCLELEMEVYSLDEVDLTVELPTVDRIITV